MPVKLENISSVSPNGSGMIDVTSDLNLVGTSPNPVYRINGVPIGTGGVTTVFGRSGAVVATAGDYTAAQVTNAVSTVGSYADPLWITSLAWGKITGAPSFVTGPAGATGQLQYNGGGTPPAFAASANLHWDSANNRLGIGTTSPAHVLDVVTLPGPPVIGIGATRFNNDIGGAVVYLTKSRGTQATPLPVQIDDFLGWLGFGGRISGQPNAFAGAAVEAAVTSVNANNLSADLIFSTNDGSVTVPVEHVRITAAGLVGINNPSPRHALDIIGGSTVIRRRSNDTEPARLYLHKTRGTTTAPTPIESGDWLAYIAFPGYAPGTGATQAPDGAAIHAIAAAVGNQSLAADLLFETNPGTLGQIYPNERMRITSQGRVGIGTANPAYLLDVAGDVNLGAGSVYRINGVPIGGGSQWVDVTGGIAYTGGHVGIGTASPNAYSVLDVVGNIRMSGNRSTIFYRGDTPVMVGGLQITGFGDSVPGTPIILTPTDDAGNTQNRPISLGGFGSFTSNTVDLTVTGNVGIGTNTPTARLRVDQIYGGWDLLLNQPVASWGSAQGFNDHRFMQTSSAATDGNFKYFAVGAGGVAIGNDPPPPYGSSDALYVRGNLGIGAVGCQAPLHIASWEAGFGTVKSCIVLQNTAGQDAVSLRIAGLGYANNHQTAIDFIQNSGSNWTSAMAFLVNNGAGQIEAMRIPSHGALHIGPGADTFTTGDLGVSRGSGQGAIYFGGQSAYIYYNGSSWVFNPALAPAHMEVFPSQPPYSSVGNGQIVFFYVPPTGFTFFYRNPSGQLYQGGLTMGPIVG